jgi:hypothetical protein
MSEKEQQQFSNEEVEAGLRIAHSEYFMQVVALLSYTDLKDLSYVKVPITTPDGGTYLISILHIEGPKVQLDKLAEAATAQEADKSKLGIS